MHTGRCACGGGESPMLGEPLLAWASFLRPPPPPQVAHAPAGHCGSQPASTPAGCFRCCPRWGQGTRRGRGRGHLRRGRGRGHLVASAAARRHLVGRPRKTLSVALFDATRRHLVGRSHLSMIRESRSFI